MACQAKRDICDNLKCTHSQKKVGIFFDYRILYPIARMDLIFITACEHSVACGVQGTKPLPERQDFSASCPAFQAAASMLVHRRSLTLRL